MADDDTDDVDPGFTSSASPVTLRRVTCAMVRRAMSAPDYGGADVTQASQSVG
ncbi:hypothetical protein [Bifidobacterium simiarum]|uniref:hypothetical protein n=1 Tax=Bifidobacterium simiarum TaxID=2045441 RepID=UPI0013FE4EE8|nr:hypothetical protein [Bifidobacterium simiarum]